MSSTIRVMRLLNRCRFRILVAWLTKVPWSMSHAVDGTYIKAQQDKMVNSSLCKKASVDTYFNVMEVNLIIYNDDVIMMN